MPRFLLKYPYSAGQCSSAMYLRLAARARDASAAATIRHHLPISVQRRLNGVSPCHRRLSAAAAALGAALALLLLFSTRSKAPPPSHRLHFATRGDRPAVTAAADSAPPSREMQLARRQLDAIEAWYEAYTNRTSGSGVIVYNRVGKCGSTTLLQLLDALQQKEQLLTRHTPLKLWGDDEEYLWRWLRGTRSAQRAARAKQRTVVMDGHAAWVNYTEHVSSLL